MRFWIERSAPATNWDWLCQNEEKVLVFCFKVTLTIFVIYNLALRPSILTHKSHMHANNTCQGSGSGNIHSGLRTQREQSFKVSHSSNQSPPIYFISPYFAAFRHSFASFLEPQNIYLTSFCVLWTFTSPLLSAVPNQSPRTANPRGFATRNMFSLLCAVGLSTPDFVLGTV